MRSLKFGDYFSGLIERHAVNHDNLVILGRILFGEVFERLSNESFFVVTGNNY
jgi:hypothetical protein